MISSSEEFDIITKFGEWYIGLSDIIMLSNTTPDKILKRFRKISYADR